MSCITMNVSKNEHHQFKVRYNHVLEPALMGMLESF
jgi:hypothetical protein